MAPGITVHRVGGHSKGLQCVRVRTRRGHVVLAADASHLYAHLHEGRVFPVTYNVGDVLEGYRTLKRLAESPDHIVPGHDPEVAGSVPGGAARPRGPGRSTRRAAGGVSLRLQAPSSGRGSLLLALGSQLSFSALGLTAKADLKVRQVLKPKAKSQKPKAA